MEKTMALDFLGTEAFCEQDHYPGWPWQEFALANSFSNAETHADPEKNQHDVSEDVYSGHGGPRGEGEDLTRREWSQDQFDHARTISGSELRDDVKRNTYYAISIWYYDIANGVEEAPG
jgi:hypothetical protein